MESGYKNTCITWSVALSSLHTAVFLIKTNIDEYDCFLGSMFCYPIITYLKFKVMYVIKYNKENFADTFYQQ